MSVKTTEDGSSAQMLQLESAILNKTRGQAYYTKLQDWLISQQTDDVTPQKCSVEMMKKIITVLQEVLQCKQFQQARVIVLAIQHVTKFLDFPSGLPVLLSSGLVEILVYAFQVTQTSISTRYHSTEKENRADLLMQTILETANDIADYNPEAKQLTVKRFTDKLMDLIIDDRKVFQLHMEAQRTLNLLLENCPGHLTQSLVESDVIKKLMQKLAESLPSLGDFEMQVARTETLARLVTKSKRPAYAAEWFPEKKFSSAFLAIQDLNFETDCRKFLNYVNETCGGKKSVHSFPCQAAFLGGFRLLQPPDDDENLSAFWVDFNSASNSVTMYVAENSEDGCEDGEGSMWETVTIKSNMVKHYSFTKQASTQKLQLELLTPACDILHFCPSQNRSATIVFGSSIDLSDALANSLGEEKLMPSQQTQKKSSVSKVNVRVNRADSLSTGLINGHVINDNVMTNGSHQPEAVQRNPHNPVINTPVRPKVSVPIVPMRTPTLTTYRSSPSVASTLSSNGYNSSGSKRNSGSHQPKTPTRQSSSSAIKVKTPLQIVVDDKHPAPSTADEGDTGKTPRTAKKVSSTTAAVPINIRQSQKVDDKEIQSVSEKLHDDYEKGKGNEKRTGPSTDMTKSVEEPKPSTSKVDSKKTRSSSKSQDVASNLSKDHQGINSKPEDKNRVPEPDDESDSQTTGKRIRGGKCKKKTASSSQESQKGNDYKGTVSEPDDESDSQTTGRKTRGRKGKKKTASSSQESQERNNNKGGRQTRSSKKFKLYSADNTMLLPDSQETGRQRSKRRKKGNEEEEQKEIPDSQSSQETGRQRSKHGKKGKEEEEQKEIPDSQSSQETGRQRSKRGKKGNEEEEQKEIPDSQSSQETGRRRSKRGKKGNEEEEQKEIPDSQSSQETGRRRSKRGKKGQEQEGEEQQKEITSPKNPDAKEPVVKAKTKAQERRDGEQKKSMPDSSQDLDEDVVIASSIQDGSDEDIIPPSFCPIQDDLIAIARRRIEQTVSTNTSICQSPSLSTITEESTQSQKSTSTISTGINEGQTVTQRSKDHSSNPLSPVKEESNMIKNGNTKTRSKKPPPQDKTAHTKQSSNPTGKEANRKDPYLFTDTESVKSLDLFNTQNTAKQKTGRKRNNKQGFDNGKVATARGKGSQISTQSFSPELSQESPYLSQNDFRSPIELSSGVKTKQGKGKKTTKTGRRGKENVQSSNRQDEDSLSDVEIMRDANASMSSVKDNYAIGSCRHNGDEVYKLSGNIAAKLLQNKAELEKILKSSDKKLKQKKAELGKYYEIGLEMETSASKKNESRREQSSIHSNETSPGKEDKALRSKSSTVGNKREVDKSSKRSKSTNAFNSFAKPKFDPALLKFPTRVGPIPTPDALEEESKKMKKKSTSQQSTNKPVSWDESDEEECNRGTEEFQPTGQNIERNSITLTQRKDQPSTDQVEDNRTDHSDNDGIDEDTDDDDQAKTQKQKSGRIGMGKMHATESTKTKKGHSKGKQKQGKANLDRDKEIDSQEEVIESRKPKRDAKKASSDEYMEEQSTDEAVYQSDDEVTNRKKSKHVTKQKKQKGKKTRNGDFTEESDNDKMQSNHHVETRKQSIKSQEKNRNKVINKVQEKARKPMKDYSSEEFDIQDIQAEHQSDVETQSKPSKGKQQKTKSIEQQNTKSARSKQHASSDNRKQKAQKSRRKFSSQIEDAESDENKEHSSEEDKDEEVDRMTVTSVDSFHSLCKKIIEKSGGGIGATRSRRHIPRVNYKDPENSEIDFSTSGSSEASAPQTSHRSESKMSRKETELASPASSKLSSIKSDDSQSVITNRSWLVEKPKLKVSTYSKTRAEQWIGVGPPMNLDTVSAKKRPKQKARPTEAAKQTAASALPKKPKPLLEQSDNDAYLFYNNGIEDDVSQQKARKSGRQGNNKTKKTRAPSALQKKPKRPREESDEDDDAYQYYDSEEEQHISQQKAKRGDQPSNKKKLKKTISNKRQEKQQEDNEEEEFYELETRAPPALPKKPKRPRAESDEDDDVYQYYYREEGLSQREASDQPSNNKKSKKTDSSKRQKRQLQENVEEEFDDLEMMRSQQSRHNATPISSALLDYNTPRCDVDVYPMTPASMMHEDDNEDIEIQLSQVSFVTPRMAKTLSSSRTPKVLSFEDEVASQQDEDDVLLVSGSAKGPRPTKSAHKRKYPDMSEESEDETSMSSDKEKDSQQELQLSQGQGMLKPKNLFRTSFTNALQSKRRSLALEDECDDIVVAEEADTNDAASSFPSLYDPDSTMLQMTNMMKVVGENIKEKMRRKETNAQKMTERTIKTAQKQVSRLWSGQHKARKDAQEQFQDKLLTEIVGLESDLDQMEHSLNKSQALLQQHQHRVSTTLVNHVKKVHKLESDYKSKGEALEVQLGKHLVRNVKGLLKQALIDMQKKMVQDVQHHEIQTMKRSLQSILS